MREWFSSLSVQSSHIPREALAISVKGLDGQPESAENAHAVIDLSGAARPPVAEEPQAVADHKGDMVVASDQVAVQLESAHVLVDQRIVGLVVLGVPPSLG